MVALYQNIKSEFTVPGRCFLRHGVIWLILIIGAVWAALFIPFRMNLVVEAGNHRILQCWDIHPGSEFVITYTHSVNKTPVDEYFRIREDYTMVLTKTAFRSFGVGIPNELVAGEELRKFPDRMEIVNINRVIPQIVLAVGTVANHQIIVGGHRVKMTDFARPQQTVRIYIRKVSAYDLLRRDMCERESCISGTGDRNLGSS